MNELLTPTQKALFEPITQKATEGNFQDSEVVGITFDLPIITAMLKKAHIAIPDDTFLQNVKTELAGLLANTLPDAPCFMLDGDQLQKQLINRAQQLATDQTALISYDDSIEQDGFLNVRSTTYFDVNGTKLGSGAKPGITNPYMSYESLENCDRAVILDMGIWSGKTILPTVEYLQKRGVPTTVLTGFIKSKAIDRITQRGADVEALLFSDYNDWAESRDLMTVFIKSGFFIGKKSGVRDTYIPQGTLMENMMACYTQPTTNLDIHYPSFQQMDTSALSQQLLQLSAEFWQQTEDVNNGNLTLGTLRKAYPRRFALPLLYDDQRQRGISFSVNDRPSEAIQKLMI